jgi:hypothetical protein
MQARMVHTVDLDDEAENIEFSSIGGGFEFGFSYSGKIFEKLDNQGEDETYRFKNSTDNIFYHGNEITITEYRRVHHINISDTGSFYFNSPITDAAVDDFKTIIDNIIKEQVKAKGRQLTTLRNFPLPENTLSVVASHLTGNRGSLESQINKQKQKAGISLAPKARKTRKVNGRKL